MNNPIKTLIATAITGILGTSATFAAPSFDQKDITAVGWKVTYDGSEYDAVSNTTTFFYSLTADSGEKDLSHWVLALDDAPVASTGCNAVKTGLDPTTGVSGWKCDDGQDAGSTQAYSITVNGNVGTAETAYSVKGGTYYAVGGTTGPGDLIADTKTYSLSGLAYVDANNNGWFDVGEPVLSNVTVALSDGQSTKTTLQGAYKFENLVAGHYDVDVPAQTFEASDDFNEALAEYFIPTTSPVLSVGVNDDVADQNFGFGVNTVAVLEDFDAADPDGDGFSFTGTGKTIGFWKHQITSAKAGKTKGVQVSAAAVNDYLYNGTTSVKTLFIDVFGNMPTTDKSAYDYALAILGSTSSNEVDLLRKQLMGTELNYQAGLGIANADGLQGVVAAWSEYLVKNANDFSREALLDAKDICDLINNSGE